MRHSILITGHHGFIGRHVYNHLKGLDNCTVDGLSKGQALPNKEYDMVIHCAGTIPAKAGSYFDYIEGNINLTNAVLTQYKHSRIIFISTMEVYGSPETHTIKENTYPYRQSVYGMSKYLAEKLLIENIENHLILRLPTVIGSDASETFVTRMTDSIVKGNEVRVYNGTKKINSIVHISDIVSIVDHFTNRGFTGHNIYNVATHDCITLRSIPLILSKKLGKQPPRIVNTCNSFFDRAISVDKLSGIIKPPSVIASIEKYIEELSKNKDLGI